MFAPRARVRRRPASRQPTPSSRRRDPSPVWLRVPCRHLRGDGADAERARVVAAVAAAERAQRARREASRARDVRASSSRAASAGLTPADAKQPRRDRDPSPVWLRVPCRHLRGDGADAERARVVAAVAAAERAQRARREASRARDVRASSSRAASAGLTPADAKQPPPRPRPEPRLAPRALPSPQRRRR